MDKHNVVYLFNGILFGPKQNEVLIQAIAWMNLENDILNEGDIPHDSIYMKCQKKQFHRHRR